MNCPCCSGPLPADALRRGGPVCSWCGSRLDLDLQGWHHLSACSPAPDLHCPDCRCGLERLRLPGPPEPLELARCPDCLGLFLPLGALEQLLERESTAVQQVDHRLLQALSETPRAAPAPPRYRPCPSCGDLMNRSLQGRRSGVVVDRCRDHGLWLDAGELRQLLEWARAGGVLLDLERRREEVEEELRRLRAEARESQASRAMEASSLAGGPSTLPVRVDLAALLLNLARRLP